MQFSQQKCHRCGDELAEGVRFCVACGATNSNPDAGREAAARLDMQVHQTRSRRERFLYWWRRLMFGIRR